MLHTHNIDDKLSSIVFLTYRSFSTGEEFLCHLIKTFYTRLDQSSTQEEREAFKEFEMPIKLKVLRTLHVWIENHWHDFGLSSELRAVLNAFLAVLAQSPNPRISDLSKGLLMIANIQYEWLKDLLNSYTNETKVGKTIDSLIESVEPDLMAEQLCIFNSDIFKKIHPIEFLNEIWKKPGQKSTATPTFTYFVERFDQESYWAATEILAFTDLKKRTQVLKKFIYIIKVFMDLIVLIV